MVQVIPKNLKTFGDLAENCKKDIDVLAEKYSRIDLVFNRNANLLKSKNPPQKTKTPIRRIIENGDVSLPKQWKIFVSLPDNKEDLYRFLSSELSQNQVHGTNLVLAGGREVLSSNNNICTERLDAQATTMLSE